MAVTLTGPSQTAAPQVAVGRIKTTTAVALGGFSVGFSPRYVCVVNASERVKLEWYENMAQNSAVKTVAAGTVTKVTATAITTSATGFSVGLDTDLITAGGAASAAGELLDFIAFG